MQDFRFFFLFLFFFFFAASVTPSAAATASALANDARWCSIEVRSAKLGLASAILTTMLVNGLVLCVRSHSSIAARSYVWPSDRTTGSFMISVVMGQRNPLILSASSSSSSSEVTTPAFSGGGSENTCSRLAVRTLSDFPPGRSTPTLPSGVSRPFTVPILPLCCAACPQGQQRMVGMRVGMRVRGQQRRHTNSQPQSH